MDNLSQLGARLTKLDDIATQLAQSTEQLGALRNWVGPYRQELIDSKEELKRRFGVELEQKLQEKGLSLSGHYPDLKTGLFTLELDFERQQVTLWLGPKQEHLDKCRLSVAEVVDRIEKAKHLGTFAGTRLAVMACGTMVCVHKIDGHGRERTNSFQYPRVTDLSGSRC